MRTGGKIPIQLQDYMKNSKISYLINRDDIIQYTKTYYIYNNTKIKVFTII